MSDVQNIETPHERRPFKDHGHMDVITLGNFTIGRGVFEPGWRWSNDVKPIAGTDSCQTHHTGICLSGQMTVRFDDGHEVTVGPGDVLGGARRQRVAQCHRPCRTTGSSAVRAVMRAGWTPV